VFDRFWQAKEQRFFGTGLGLSIAKGLITAHGGKIWFESKKGMGSTFSFTLPIRMKDDLPHAAGVQKSIVLRQAG
jgi:signal transduction histidine kinase